MKASGAFFCSERIIKVLVARRRRGDQRELCCVRMEAESDEICCFFGASHLTPSAWPFGCLHLLFSVRLMGELGCE